MVTLAATVILLGDLFLKHPSNHIMVEYITHFSNITDCVAFITSPGQITAFCPALKMTLIMLIEAMKSS